MSSKDGVLHCVLKKQWFEKIKSGEKTHEYREVKPYWCKRVGRFFKNETDKIRFTLGMTSEPEKTMVFEIKAIDIKWGKNTDLAIDKPVYDIELGERLE